MIFRVATLCVSWLVTFSWDDDNEMYQLRCISSEQPHASCFNSVLLLIIISIQIQGIHFSMDMLPKCQLSYKVKDQAGGRDRPWVFRSVWCEASMG